MFGTIDKPASHTSANEAHWSSFLLACLIISSLYLSACQSTSQSSSSSQSSQSANPNPSISLPDPASPSESTAGQTASNPQAELSDGQGEQEKPAAESASEPTGGEKISELDRELNESLAEFDGMIFDQQASAATMGSPFDPQTNSSDTETGINDENEPLFEEGDIYEGLPGYGDHPDSTSEDGNQTAGASSDETVSNPDGEDSELNGSGASGSGSVPADITDGSDDDIVARQIREAAMKEKDPVLKDKLWDEYRKYKNQ